VVEGNDLHTKKEMNQQKREKPFPFSRGVEKEKIKIIYLF
jgi:hypothetical protein